MKLLPILLVATCATAHAFTVEKLRCEYRENPICIDEAKPRLTWLIEGDLKNQTGYEILVASSEGLLKPGKADLWDSGKVASDETVNIEYAGKPLASRQEVFWKVEVFDEKDRGEWSKPAAWTMGLLDSGDWKADYISFKDATPVFKDTKSLFLPPARQYRKEFSAAKSVKRATIYATALGIYELHLNGERVGDAYFAPGWTDYRQRAYYRSYDVTRQVKRGVNAIGAWLADGWYSGYIGFGLLTGIGVEHIGRYTYGKTPALMAQLEIEYDDGSREVVATDPSWKVTGAGPVQEADFLMGEKYDARNEMTGWDKSGFDDSKWEPAIPAKDNGSAPATFYGFQNPEKPGAKLENKGTPVDLGFARPPKIEAFPGNPVRVTQELKPIAITEPKPGTYIFNLGQNIAGIIRLKVKGEAGQEITLRYGEMLYPDGHLMTENLRKARAIDHYICKGGGTEIYQPRFTFHGFQYVEITGLKSKPSPGDISGLVLHSDTPMTSDFECNDPTVNKIFRNVVWTQRSNFLDLPTDCPQRDERFGWTGDAQIYVRCATINADVAAFYTKWIRELMESQRPSGTFPGYAPFPFQHGWDFGTAWCDAGVICPWTIWQSYGDTRIIERCWAPMTKFMEWRKATSHDFLGIVHGNDWGDWLSLAGKTPLDYVDTVYFAYSANLMSQMAAAVGKKQEAADYAALFNSIKAAFAKKYLKPDGSLAVDTQTAYATALFMDLLPADARKKAGDILAQKIRERASADNSGMGTGFLGTRPLPRVLTDTGHHDLALELLLSHKFPSWGYEVDQGATTIWERWNSFTKEKGFGDAGMNSFAHYSFGAVCQWMFESVAGINSAAPGYKKILIAPQPGGTLTHVKAHYDSIRGRIATEWKNEGGKFRLDVTIPPNTTAEVRLPTNGESYVPKTARRISDGLYEVGAGAWTFEAK